MEKTISNAIEEHKKALSFLEDNFSLIKEIADVFVDCLRNGKKIIFCGNGGSAADSQHLAAEIVGRFKKNRKALPSIALTTDTSILTAIGNDFGFDKIFVRQVEALAVKGDVLVAISTSGNSANVLEAVEFANNNGIKTVAFLGSDGGKLKTAGLLDFTVPFKDTARVQEIHILAGHILCEIIENELFS